jgi:hypothetical protein
MKPTDPPSPHPSRKASAGQAPPAPDPSQKASAGHGHDEPDELHNDDVAYEHSDINVRAAVMSAVAVTVVCLVTAVLMYGLFKVLEGQAEARDPKLSPLAMPPTQMPPTTLTSPTFGSAPEPRLMTNEPRKLHEVRGRADEQLHGYGWVDEKAGVARIPIDEAKKLVLERGLPVRPDPIGDPRVGTHLPALGESSSGRTITRSPAAEPAAPAPAPAQPAPHKSVH